MNLYKIILISLTVTIVYQVISKNIKRLIVSRRERKEAVIMKYVHRIIYILNSEQCIQHKTDSIISEFDYRGHSNIMTYGKLIKIYHAYSSYYNGKKNLYYDIFYELNLSIDTVKSLDFLSELNKEYLNYIN